METEGELCRIVAQTKKSEEIIEAQLFFLLWGNSIQKISVLELGVETERGRIKVDEYYRTNVEGIYAIGDVIATPALAHVASAEAICCVENIAGLQPVPVNYENFPACTYTSPEIASVGMTERAVKS